MKWLTFLKSGIIGVLAAIGSYIASAFGGWDTSIITLLSFMAIDFLTGLIVAGVFKNSKKTDNGALKSSTGWKGLCKKGVTLLIVVVANRLDMQLATTYIRDAVCIAFIVNETISIVENAGLMGIPIPKVITKAIELLKATESNENEPK